MFHQHVLSRLRALKKSWRLPSLGNQNSSFICSLLDLPISYASSTYMNFLIMLYKISLILNLYLRDKNFLYEELVPGEYFQ